MNKDEIKKYVYEKIINYDEGSESKRKEHTQKLIDCSAGDADAKLYVKNMIKRFLLHLNESTELVEEIYAESWGLGVLEKYDVPEVDEIMVHGTKILIQKNNELIVAPETFDNYDKVIAVMRRCLEFDKSKDLNVKNAIVEAKRKDGARIQAIIPPVGKMPYLNIRKFESFLPTTENMLNSGTLIQEEVDMFRLLVKGRANIVVIGEMGSGKTTFMKWLMQFIPANTIVGSMETTLELNLDELYPDKHWVQLEERLPDYPLGKLFPSMLRGNLDAMLVGECRSYEANELVKVMGRGHSGSIGTAHSMGPIEMVDDFVDMIMESGKVIYDLKFLRYRIARTVDIVVRFRKLPNSKRRILAGVYELVTDNKTAEYKAVEIFEYEIDEENPGEGGNHVKKGTISNSLMKKLNFYGVKKSDINKVF